MKKDLQSVIRSALKLSLLVALLIMVLVTTTFSPTITGSIVNKNGDKLTGVSIQIKGTTVFNAFDDPGNFLINTSGKTELVFSSIGFKSQEILVAGKKEIWTSNGEYSMSVKALRHKEAQRKGLILPYS